MTPQSTFMVLAAVSDGQENDLRALLATMNHQPGMADPQNALVPFAQFDRLHVARFVVLDPPTPDDITVYGIPPYEWTTSLVFLGDCDGPADAVLVDIANHAGEGLRRIFAHCQGFSSSADLVTWMRSREQPAAANYINWIGRTVLQVHEEQALHKALIDRLSQDESVETAASAVALRDSLIAHVKTELEAHRLALTPPAPTPSDWKLRNIVHLVGVPVALLLLAPFLLLASPVLIFMLRSREKTDPDLAPRPDPEHVLNLAEREDHDISNQFTVLGDIKPGRFRRWTTTLLLWLLDYSARHIYNRGYLTRVQTIHFARWVFLDDKKRLFFASNYDGSLESYMDDFINKVAWGINLVFSNGVGYPRTDWLIKRGARDELKYKRILRNHQVITDVWYKAYPGLSVVDLQKNSAIRAGLEQTNMTEREAREWLSLI